MSEAKITSQSQTACEKHEAPVFPGHGLGHARGALQT